MKTHKEITKEEIKIIIEKHQEEIFRYCYHMLRNKEEAEDALQEVFMKFYVNIDRIKNIKSVKSMLYKITHNYCVNIIRRQNILKFIKLNDEIKYDNFTVENEIIKKEIKNSLTAAIQKLTAVERSVVILRFVEEMSYDEISEMTGKKSANLRKIFERAKKKIQKNMCDMEGGDYYEKVSFF